MSKTTQKCCFCLPLRGGLLFLAYINVVGGALGLILDVTGLQFVYNWSLMDAVLPLVEGLEYQLGIYYLPYLVDLAYGVALLCALHLNDVTVLNIYIWYSMTYIGIVLYVFAVILCGSSVEKRLLFIVAIDVLYQAGIALLVRRMKIEIVCNTDSAEARMCYNLKSSSDVESQPLPAAPAQAQPATNL
ncbi:hypothetical protein O0L34_g13603 [Tuta absoluta]|nr:hypothetical protein O0L34_g13603 [Tuta absoluta]